MKHVVVGVDTVAMATNSLFSPVHYQTVGGPRSSAEQAVLQCGTGHIWVHTAKRTSVPDHLPNEVWDVKTKYEHWAHDVLGTG